MGNAEQLSIPDQLDRLKERGLITKPSDRDRDLHSVEVIGYYKLKEFAYPFSSLDENGVLRYSNITFSELITRYYQDKNLRIYLLHMIEDIEVTLNNRLSYLLGEKYGAYGYLRFSSWCNRNISKFKIEEKQYYFKRDLLKKIKRSNLKDIQEKHNLNSDGFPTVWLMIDALTFGDTINLLKIMSKNNLKVIAKEFNCTSSELLSWLGCLNLVRNICCHNSDLLDIKFKTKPKVPKAFEDDIYKRGELSSNSIAVAIFIAVFLMKSVNHKYKFNDIIRSIHSIVDYKLSRSNSLGFMKVNSIAAINNNHVHSNKR